MCILSSPNAAVPTTPPAAQTLPPQTRQKLALEALAGASITDLANHHHVNRKHAERCVLYDFAVAQLRERTPQCPHCLEPLCTYLVNQRDTVLAFAQQLDADLCRVAEDFQTPLTVIRQLLQVQEIDVRDSRRWPQQAVASTVARSLL